MAAPLSLEDDDEVEFLRWTLPVERRSGATAAVARPAGAAAARQDTALLREVALALMAVAFMVMRCEERGEKKRRRQKEKKKLDA